MRGANAARTTRPRSRRRSRDPAWSDAPLGTAEAEHLPPELPAAAELEPTARGALPACAQGPLDSRGELRPPRPHSAALEPLKGNAHSRWPWLLLTIQAAAVALPGNLSAQAPRQPCRAVRAMERRGRRNTPARRRGGATCQAARFRARSLGPPHILAVPAQRQAVSRPGPLCHERVCLRPAPQGPPRADGDCGHAHIPCADGEVAGHHRIVKTNHAAGTQERKARPRAGAVVVPGVCNKRGFAVGSQFC